MDTSNVTSLIYQAVFITIFIVASTITINLFTTINNYSEEINKVVKADAISEVVSENEAKLELVTDEAGNESYVDGLTHELSGFEVYSIVNNYGLVYEKNNELYIISGDKYNNNDYAFLPYIVSVVDKDKKYVNNKENINLTSVYDISYSDEKLSNILVHRIKYNQILDIDHGGDYKTEELNSRRLILTEKGGK